MKNSKLITTGRTTRQLYKATIPAGTEKINYEAFLDLDAIESMPFLDLDTIESMARRAASNKSGRSHDGPLEVRITGRARIR